MTQGLLPPSRLLLSSPPFRTSPGTLWPTGPTEIGLPPSLVATAPMPTLPTVLVNLSAPQPDCWEPDFDEESLPLQHKVFHLL